MTVHFLPEMAFVYLLVFSRLGTMIMLLPALGDSRVPARVRLGLALAISFAVYPIVKDSYPAMPATPMGLAGAVGFEVLIGVFIGGAARLVMSALQVAGTLIAFQTGLAFAQNFDPNQGTQTAIVGSFLTLIATTLIFVLDLHHPMIAAMRDSYILFAPGAELPIGDFAELAVKTVATSFALGFQLAAPFIVFGLIFYLGIGVLSKLMPQVQIFFIAMPANILLGFVLLMLLIGALMLWFTEHFEQAIMRFVV